jgi:small subunit ribosomal protein S6
MDHAPIRSYSALRNTQREFETTIIIRPDSNKEAIADLVNRLQRIFERNGGRMQKIDNWGLRTLAYPIAAHKKGVYLYVRFLGGSDMVKELERNLRIWDEVVRYLTVVIDGDVNPEARPSDVDDETLDAASDVAPDPLDIAAEKAAALSEGYDDDDDDDDRRHDDDDDDDEDND